MAKSDYSTLQVIVENELLGSYNETPKFYENQEVRNDSLLEYIRIFVIVTDSENANVGGSSSIETGAIMIQIFTEVNKGRKRSNEIKVILKDLLKNAESESGDLSILDIRPVEAEPIDRYYQQNLQARFMFSYHD